MDTWFPIVRTELEAFVPDWAGSKPLERVGIRDLHLQDLGRELFGADPHEPGLRRRAADGANPFGDRAGGSVFVGGAERHHPARDLSLQIGDLLFRIED